MKVRLARSEESAALQAVHLCTWQATYQDVVPSAWFAARLLLHRHENWLETMRLLEANSGATLALVAGDTVVGLCQFGPTADPHENPAHVGEIHRLCVIPARQGRGGGRLLLEAARDAFCEQGKLAATLWVWGADRRARGFYEHLGWRPDGGRQGTDFPHLRYRWVLS